MHKPNYIRSKAHILKVQHSFHAVYYMHPCSWSDYQEGDGDARKLAKGVEVMNDLSKEESEKLTEIEDRDIWRRKCMLEFYMKAWKLGQKGIT